MTVVQDRDVEPAPSGASAVEPCPDPLSRWFLAALGALFLAATFAQAPGLIVDDTKLPVLMAPLAWMRSSLHLWSQTVASGSVQDETFGYLFPMAPFFQLMHLLHVPVWCAERIWLALLLTVGAWGVVRVAEALGIGRRWVRILGAVAYCVAPIVVDWAAVSAVLLAVMLLPWMLRPLIVGARTGSPRRAAATSGVAIALMGGVNATVIFSTLPLGALWLLTRAAGPRRRSLTGWWIVSVGLACFWWAVPTYLQGKYGYNYLPYTETSSVTTATGSAFEALRGTSFWQNFDDLGGPLLPGGWTLVTSGVAIVATSVVTALGLAGLARRIPERLFLVASLSFGVVVIAIGYGGTLGSPFSPMVVRLLGGALAPLRNVSKFSPDVTLPLVLGLIWMVSNAELPSVTNRIRGRLGGIGVRPVLGAVAVIAVVLAAMPIWQGQLYPTGGFTALPHYWSQTADWLDSHQGHQTALVVPGANFAEYTWGRPEDEPLAVLAHTSVTVRSIIPLGSNGNTVMLNTIQDVLASGTAQPGFADYLARSGIDFVVERNDLNLKATGAIPPAQVHQVLSRTSGLVPVAAFGPYVPRSQAAPTRLPVYGTPDDPRLRAVEIYKVVPDSSDVQTFPAATPLVVSGSSGSLLPLAGAGVLAGRSAVLARDPDATVAAASPGATWAITDGNQRRAVQFGAIDHNTSYLLGPDERIRSRPTTIPLDFAVTSGAGTETVAAPTGVASVGATSFGSNTLATEPSEGPAAAFDGDPSTAWVASSANQSVGQSITINFDRAIPLSSIAITTLDDTPQRPRIDKILVTTDQGSVLRRLPSSAGPIDVAVAPGPTRHLSIAIKGVHHVRHVARPPLGAGIVQISVPGVTFHPAMRLPTDALAAFAATPTRSALVNVDDPVTNPNVDFTSTAADQPAIPRKFTLPSALTATTTGSVVPLPGASLEDVLSRVASPSNQVVGITASSWLQDLPRFRAQNLVERSALPWIAGLDDHHPSLTLHWSGLRSVSSLSVGLYAQASRPTELTITSPAGVRHVAVPATGGTISFAAMTTDSLTITFDAVVKVLGRLPTGELTVGLPVPLPVVLPVGLSSIGVPGVTDVTPTPPAATTPVTLACGSGPAVTVDGTTVATSVTGTLGDLVDLRTMRLQACAPPIPLAAGAHVVAFPAGGAFRVTGLLLDDPASTKPSTASTTRVTRVHAWSPAHRTVAVGPGPSTYLQVAQNFSPGWRATLGGRTLRPVRLDGWEQGWVVPAGAGGLVTMTFAPDSTYRMALALGGLFLLVLLLLALSGRNSSRRTPVGPRRRLHVAWLAAAAAVVVLCAGGPLVLLLAPLAYLAHRWGSRAAAAVAFLSFVAAGIVVAVHPVPVIGAHAGSFGGAAQFLSVLALCAVLGSVVVGERRMRDERSARPATGEASAPSRTPGS
jgi:arabinofuranan 3-O-arabinosyltransferase